MPFDSTPQRTPAAELMATPEPMLAWLRTFSPDDVVTDNVGDSRCCLGALFLRAHGYPKAEWLCISGYAEGDYSSRVTACPAIYTAISRLHLNRGGKSSVTAAEAIAAIESATKE